MVIVIIKVIIVIISTPESQYYRIIPQIREIYHIDRYLEEIIFQFLQLAKPCGEFPTGAPVGFFPHGGLWICAEAMQCDLIPRNYY